MSLKRDTDDPSLVDYRDNSHITGEEMKAVGHYQDITTKQFDWSLIRHGTPNTYDNSAINSYLRKKMPKLNTDDDYNDYPEEYSLTDKRQIQKMMEYLDSATTRDKISKPFVLYRGVKNKKRLDDNLIEYQNALIEHRPPKPIVEEAFSSFSLKHETASSFAKMFTNKPCVLVYVVNPLRDYGLYLDTREHEILFPRKFQFVVVGAHKDVRNNTDETLYMIKRVY